METNRLVRTKQRILGGVCGGFANFLGWDPVWVRLLFLIFSIATAVITGILVYLVLWVVMPEEK